MAPKNIIRYIVAHEVAHLEHFNHSIDFWTAVLFLFGPLPVLASNDLNVSKSHSFVANVARKVSPSVVRIDIERYIKTD